MPPLSFVGTGARLADADLPRLGHEIGVGEDEVHAVLDVETCGTGWDAHARPKMLFEPHRLYALTAGKVRDAAVKAGVAYPAWGAHPYPGDSYPRLQVAIGIAGEEIALRAASWGLGQIMGENHVVAGFGSATEMVQAFLTGETAQLAAMIAFIKAEHLDDELRAHNWAAFARGYNGPKYAANGYHLKLAAAFRKWAAIRDTRWAPIPTAATLRTAYASTPDRPVSLRLAA